MKKLIATLCIAFGLVSASFAATPSAPLTPATCSLNVCDNPNDPDLDEEDPEDPDKIIIVVDEDGNIIDVIIIKNK